MARKTHFMKDDPTKPLTEAQRERLQRFAMGLREGERIEITVSGVTSAMVRTETDPTFYDALRNLLLLATEADWHS